jgi:hypothetical protein
LAARQAFESADGLRRPPLQRQGKDGGKKRQATAEAKTRKGEPRKRKDGKRQEQGKAKQGGGGANPKKSRPLQKAAATHKDSVWGPGERKIGSRTDLKVGHYRRRKRGCASSERAPGI